MSAPAFPTVPGAKPGLTKGEYFAGQALVGILANPECASMPDEKIVTWAAEIGEMLARKMG